jgi:hypothetical protein
MGISDAGEFLGRRKFFRSDFVAHFHGMTGHAGLRRD